MEPTAGSQERKLFGRHAPAHERAAAGRRARGAGVAARGFTFTPTVL